MELEKDNRIKMAYLAGVIDGDAGIYISDNIIHIQIAKSCEKLMMFLLTNFGGIIGKSRDLPQWALCRKKESEQLLFNVKDFLIEKRKLVIAALKYDKEKVRELNSFTDQSLKLVVDKFQSDEERWAYTAGFIDTDGHITLKKRNRNSEAKKRCYSDYYLEIGCGGTDFRSTHFIHNFLGFGSLKIRPHKRCVNNQRSDLRFIKRDHIIHILDKCLPYLIVKKENALVAKSYLNGYESKMGGNDRTLSPEQIQHRESHFQKLRLLQRRGNCGPD